MCAAPDNWGQVPGLCEAFARRISEALGRVDSLERTGLVLTAHTSQSPWCKPEIPTSAKCAPRFEASQPGLPRGRARCCRLLGGTVTFRARA